MNISSFNITHRQAFSPAGGATCLSQNPAMGMDANMTNKPGGPVI